MKLSEIKKLMQVVEGNSNTTQDKSKFVTEVTTGIQAHIKDVLEVSENAKTKKLMILKILMRN